MILFRMNNISLTQKVIESLIPPSDIWAYHYRRKSEEFSLRINDYIRNQTKDKSKEESKERDKEDPFIELAKKLSIQIDNLKFCEKRSDFERALLFDCYNTLFCAGHYSQFKELASHLD